MLTLFSFQGDVSRQSFFRVQIQAFDCEKQSKFHFELLKILKVWNAQYEKEQISLLDFKVSARRSRCVVTWTSRGEDNNARVSHMIGTHDHVVTWHWEISEYKKERNCVVARVQLTWQPNVVIILTDLSPDSRMYSISSYVLLEFLRTYYVESLSYFKKCAVFKAEK